MDAPPPPPQHGHPPRPPSPPPSPQPPAPSRRYGVHFSASSFIQAPLTALLEYSGVLRPDPGGGAHQAGAGAGPGEVSIRIVAPGEAGTSSERAEEVILEEEEEGHATRARGEEPAPAAGGGEGGRESSSSYQRYDIQQVARWVEQIDIQQVARWVEQILPFSLLLLVVFIRQHLQGGAQLISLINRAHSFFVTIWIAAVMFKSNDILRKQTALKRERKIPVLVGITVLFVVHVFGFYWCYKNGDLVRPLVMLPPKEIPPFWHAIFIILVNDTMVRQTAMIVKCLLLMYYKNSRGRSYRRQGQMLTIVEYFLLLYRALLPTPVWYRFFLNKEYGSLFSSLTTGLYLTFKLTSVVEKVQSFLTALRALSHKDFHYGSYATSEQVIATGDMCAICQEKMHVPILLRCKHIFCEDCVSEWFERERTCPLCRALVKPADLRSFGDGSTSLFFQLF
ncbi:RING finger and transmembrane domain-containing protein 2 [Dichanthelium oligosanthes]|uniref:RING finger and transmembrane domain-containing protein 2 n=1 Tax=Dichanthelium oligosanthes TaxID=888268 RepID=A0A1E5VYQ0_9POAL|nr:RING finger and transmembrane domain-containing protein 2 [Dichanthelium oligosanthes]